MYDEWQRTDPLLRGRSSRRRFLARIAAGFAPAATIATMVPVSGGAHGATG
jgi:hypothetical protein